MFALTEKFFKMKKLLLLFSFIFFSFHFSFSQSPEIKRANHWYFGNGAGIDFSSGTAVADTTGKLHTYEGCSVMSDTLGNLLFYTDGDTVWNKNHQPMPNGIGLMGCGNLGSSTNAGLIIPKPENDSVYYIFTTDCSENFPGNGFRYSVVDMSLNGGLGDIVNKNNLLFSPSVEGVAATKHCNGKDFWVVAHEFNNNNFHTYKIDNNGLNNTPIISSVGLTYDDFGIYLQFSPNGSKLASGYSNVYDVDQLFDFNNSSGEICNLINLHGFFGGGYSPLFSPDNSKLYYMRSAKYIYQYDLLAGNDSASISNTWNIVYTGPDNSSFGALNNGADTKIYIASPWDDTISVINNPNGYGLSSNLSFHSLYLDGKQSEVGLPVFIQNYFGNAIVCKTCTTDILNTMYEKNIFIQPNPSSGNFTIQLSDFFRNEFWYLKVLDIYGNNIIYEKNYGRERNVDLTKYSSGIYFIRIEASDNQIKTKIIINH